MELRPELRHSRLKYMAGVTGAFTIPVLLGIANMPALRAQSLQKFEVASVRRAEVPPNPYGVPVFPVTGGVGTPSPDRITYRATWLRNLIVEAFGVRADQITGPAWLSTERYDVVANIPRGATKEDFKLMLADLLRERFRLRFHMGSTTRPIYALRVAKNGPKLTPTGRRAGDATGVVAGVDAQGCPILPPEFQGMMGRPLPGVVCWSAQDVPIANLVRHLETPAGGRPVIDETGLTGRYDFRLRYQWGRTPDAGGVFEAASTIFTAVEEQLGLKLEPGTGSFPELIIDSIEREPTEN